MTSQPPSTSSVKATQAALAAILLLSGFCSLVYQTVWLREFRLVFGGAAPAAAAVVAVFMAGLGFGGKLFGGWVEKVGAPSASTRGSKSASPWPRWPRRGCWRWLETFT